MGRMSERADAPGTQHQRGADGRPEKDSTLASLAATPSTWTEWTRVLKHGDTFAVFDHHGDVRPGGIGEEGLFHDGTRYISCLVLEIEGARPFFLGSTVLDDNDQLTVALTNPELRRKDGAHLALGALHIGLRKFLWNGACYQQILVRNYGLAPVRTVLSLHFAADFADIFEVRGHRRKARGQLLPPEHTRDSVVLGYRGLDGVRRRTRLHFAPEPTQLTSSLARFELELEPRQDRVFSMTIACEAGPLAAAPPRTPAFDATLAEATAEIGRYSAWSCHLRTSSGQINTWINRAISDLHMMTTMLPTGPYPYAGVPWFSAPFGRDGIITALCTLWLRPDIARGVLAFLATTQSTATVPEQDAEPGKILHEMRGGEMAALAEIPFGRYYGSVDATPLFVLLAGAYHQRTGDRAFSASLWPHVEAALRWIDEFGDRDGDGFVEYHRSAGAGLVQQGWKDSDDSVFHADGTLARGPIALSEVQGYVYAARRAAAELATVLGLHERAAQLDAHAERLREAFEATFWCEELGTYGLALDGEKRLCRVRTSNAGHCLFSGIVSPERADRVARTLLGPESFSGWGIRTVATTEARYNPMSYHNGSVWPHDNALIACGLSRYGMQDLVLPIWVGMFEAGLQFDLHRMPELFCGFAQDPGAGPVLYPVACSPQAWSAASVLLLLQACLGLEISSPERRVSLTRPRLPAVLGELRIHNLEVAGSTIDLVMVRHEHDVGVDVLRREGDVEVLVRK